MNRLSIILALTLFLLSSAYLTGEANMIEDGKKVKIDYTLYVDGQVVDTSDGKEPLEYTHGQKMIIPGLEKQLAGLKVGDERTVSVSPEEGYGQSDPNAFVEVPKTQLSPDMNPEKGMVLQMQGKDGRSFTGLIVQVNEESVVLDFNHPLAGRELTFDITIVSIE